MNLHQQNQKLNHFQSSSVNVSEISVEIENKSLFETERVLVEKFNLEIKQLEKQKPQQDKSVRIEFTLNKQQFENLRLLCAAHNRSEAEKWGLIRLNHQRPF